MADEEFDVPTPEPMGAPDEEQTQDYSPDMGGQVYSQPSYQSMSSDEIQRLVETVVEEKWNDFQNKFGDILTWKTQVGDDLESVKQEILRLQTRLDSVQSAVIGKVSEFGRGMEDVSAEMKALEKVFEKILEPLTRNIRELNRVTEALRSAPGVKKAPMKKKIVKK